MRTLIKTFRIITQLLMIVILAPVLPILGAGMLSGVSKIKVLDLDLGAAVVGGAVAGFGDALTGVIYGLAPQLQQAKYAGALSKGLMAFAVKKWGGKLVGEEAAGFGSLFLTYDAIQEFVDIRGSVSNIVGGLLGKVTHNSPWVAHGPGTGAKQLGPGQAVNEAKDVADNTWSRITAGRS